MAFPLDPLATPASGGQIGGDYSKRNRRESTRRDPTATTRLAARYAFEHVILPGMDLSPPGRWVHPPK